MSTSTEQVPRIPLRGGAQIPQLGFGVFQIPPVATAQAVATALAAGYRHIDTAAAYGNEAGVAQGIREADLSRDAVFITTKCPNDDQGYDEARHAFSASLERLGTHHLDLYLIHWPVPAHNRYVATWRAFIDLQKENLVDAIGVSNFKEAHLRRIIDETGVTPAINQVELHPRYQQQGLRELHHELGIVTEAYSPLGQGRDLDDPVITEIAQRHQRTPGQVVIRWHVQLGNVVIPKSVTQERILENFAVFDFELSDEDMAAIKGLDAGERIGGDPDTFIRP